MNRNEFIKELKEMLEKYQIDKGAKIQSIKLAKTIYWILVSLYDFNNEEIKK